MPPHDADTEDLLSRASDGDDTARAELLARFRGRLRQMIAVRLDRRLAARLDPSDVVQEALADAARKLADYLERRPLPFYPWLRQLAWERLVELNRRHLYAGRRSVAREEQAGPGLPDESALQLADRLLAGGSSPSTHLLREELRARVRETLTRLAPADCEVLVLRHLEQLSTREAAAVLGISEGALKVRHLRALQRFRALLGDELAEEQP
jgi:RNA polymerase sigma-70 factor (ECF subfamily)